MVHESVEPVIERLVTALERIAAALQTREPEAADAALLAVARLDAAHDGLVDALDAAGDAARLSPRRRRALGGLDRYAVAGGELGLAVENLRALARGATRAINLDDTVPHEAVEAVGELAALRAGAAAPTWRAAIPSRRAWPARAPPRWPTRCSRRRATSPRSTSWARSGSPPWTCCAPPAWSAAKPRSWCAALDPHAT